MAGYTSRASNQLVTDFIIVARRLKELGFTYHKGTVIILEAMGEQKYD